MAVMCAVFPLLRLLAAVANHYFAGQLLLPKTSKYIYVNEPQALMFPQFLRNVYEINKL